MSALPPIDSPETFAGWHMPWPAFEVDWQRAALVLIDMQNYGCNPEAGLGPMLRRGIRRSRTTTCRASRRRRPERAPAARGFRAAGRVVVYTRHGPLLADGSDMVARRRRRDADALATTGSPALWHRGTFEHEVIEALAPVAGELVIDKNTSSALNSTGIEGLLRNMGVETVVLAGMATDMCVETTARDAADRGLNVIVVEDATATFFEHHHRAALSGFARVFGQVWDTARVLAALEATRAEAPSGRRSTASARRPPRRRDR